MTAFPSGFLRSFIGVRFFAALGAALALSQALALPVQQAYIKASNPGVLDNFGIVLAISGDTMVVGAMYEDSSATGVNGNQNNNSKPDSGAAYVFVRKGTNWQQQAYLKASNSDANDYFGSSVAVSGDTIVIGAQKEASTATGVNGNQSNNSKANTGAAYVFVRNGTNWSQQAYLKSSNPTNSYYFGQVVAVSGDTIVVGAFSESSNATGVNGDQYNNNALGSGAAYVFAREGTNWSQQAYLKASNSEYNDQFGLSVAVAGDTVVVGTPYEDSNATGANGDQSNNTATNAGAVYIFARAGTNWSQQAYLKASNTELYDGFGWAVAVAGNTVAVGAIGEDSSATGVNGDQNSNGATSSGAAFVFVRDGTNWSQQAYLKASNTDPNDGFGFVVSVSGDTLVVGAYHETSNATGVNGNQTDNSFLGAGAAYVFVRNGTNWSQQAYLKASNTDIGDAFGNAVSVSGSTVVIGAPYEASSATGVNGNQSNNDSRGYGAVYVFSGLDFGPKLTLNPDNLGGYYIRSEGHAGFTNRLERAQSVTGTWATVATQIVPPSGLVEFQDPTPPPGQAFYRTVQP